MKLQTRDSVPKLRVISPRGTSYPFRPKRSSRDDQGLIELVDEAAQRRLQHDLRVTHLSTSTGMKRSEPR